MLIVSIGQDSPEPPPRPPRPRAASSEADREHAVANFFSPSQSSNQTTKTAGHSNGSGNSFGGTQSLEIKSDAREIRPAIPSEPGNETKDT